MIEVPRRQTCACGNGCDGRSSVKWNGYLVVTCVPDDEAMGVVEAIMEAARRSIAEDRVAVVTYLRRMDRTFCYVAALDIAQGEHRREEGA